MEGYVQWDGSPVINSVLNIMKNEKSKRASTTVVDFLRYTSPLEAMLKDCNNEFQKQGMQYHFIVDKDDMKDHIDLNDFIELREIKRPSKNTLQESNTQNKEDNISQSENTLQEPNMYTGEDNTSELIAKNPHYFDHCCNDGCIIT